MIALTEKHRPRRIAEFAGLKRAKAIMSKLVRDPYPSSWLFTGASGTGKTTLAMAIAEELGAQVHHIASGQCDKQTVADVCDACHYRPMFGSSAWHVIIVDECDLMSTAAQAAFLSRLDATNFPPDAIFIFTSNSTKRLEDRFVSRCKVVPFGGELDESEFNDVARFLYRVWYAEAGHESKPPAMMASLVTKAGNIRSLLNDIEMELMCIA